MSATECDDLDDELDGDPDEDPGGHTGEYAVANYEAWQNGLDARPSLDHEHAGCPVWGLAEVWMRDGDDDWCPHWIETGLTLDEAQAAVIKLGLDPGVLVGSPWLRPGQEDHEVRLPY
jgi:hypothetical protein